MVKSSNQSGSQSSGRGKRQIPSRRRKRQQQEQHEQASRLPKATDGADPRKSESGNSVGRTPVAPKRQQVFRPVTQSAVAGAESIAATGTESSTSAKASSAAKSAATSAGTKTQTGKATKSAKSRSTSAGKAAKSAKEAKRKARSERSLAKRIGWWLLWLFLAGVITVGLVFIISFYMIRIPSVDDAVRDQRSVVYYADGSTELGSLSHVNRQIIDTSKLPKYIGQAVVASEDRTFFENNGVDLKGIARAFWNNVRGGRRQGASTLTQQYVENYYTGDRSGYVGKYREAILALKINQTQSKDEILNNYLNTIYFGRSSYGIQAAAKSYFNKDAKDLTLSEAAMIAGIIPAPSSWDPAKNPEKAKQRFERVIRLMREDGWITDQQANDAKFPEFSKDWGFVQRAGNSGYLLDHVTAEAAKELGISEAAVKNGGYRITATFQKERQDQMRQVVDSKRQGASSLLRVGMVSVNNQTGEVLAEYAGSDYGKSQRSTVTQDVLHPGSTFKPFTLMAALADGKKLTTRYSGSSPAHFPGKGDWAPTNFGHISYGTVTLRKATALSINTAFLRANLDIGPAKTKQMAVKLGIPADSVGLNDDITNTLGVSSVHLWDLAQAYTNVANYGKRKPIHVVREIRDAQNKVVYTAGKPGGLLVDENVVKQALVAMGDVVSYGSGEDAALRGWRAAGKTGTSNDNKSAVFVGMVPQVTTVVGMFQPAENGSEMSITPFGGFDSITGGTVPVAMWHDYMQLALADLTPARFERPGAKQVSDYPRGVNKNSDPADKPAQNGGDEGEQQDSPKQPADGDQGDQDVQEPANPPAEQQSGNPQEGQGGQGGQGDGSQGGDAQKDKQNPNQKPGDNPGSGQPKKQN